MLERIEVFFRANRSCGGVPLGTGCSENRAPRGTRKTAHRESLLEIFRGRRLVAALKLCRRRPEAGGATSIVYFSPRHVSAETGGRLKCHSPAPASRLPNFRPVT